MSGKRPFGTLSIVLHVLGTLVAVFGTACAGHLPRPDVQQPMPSGTAVVLPFADVEWEHLNPARGDQSPAAATLWGDRNGSEPTGFLVRFVDGFSSPPHSHNVSYRGVVIHGLVHNDDPDAEPMWMPPGSYWTQPVGGAHITSASGGSTMAYIEIEQGPYLVRPAEEATPGTEHPVNLHASNLVWLDLSTLGRESVSEAMAGPRPRVAYLWGDPTTDLPRGVLIDLPADSTAVVRSYDSTFRAVVIEGSAEHALVGIESTSTLGPGSHFSSNGGATRLSCVVETACTFYVRAEGRFDAQSE